MVSVEFELLSSEGTTIFTHSRLLPVDATADIGLSVSGDLIFVLNFTSDHDLGDVNIKITMEDVSDTFAILCCFSTLLVPTGGLIFLIGGIIWIVAAARGSKEIKERRAIKKDLWTSKGTVKVKKEGPIKGERCCRSLPINSL